MGAPHYPTGARRTVDAESVLVPDLHDLRSVTRRKEESVSHRPESRCADNPRSRHADSVDASARPDEQGAADHADRSADRPFQPDGRVHDQQIGREIGVARKRRIAVDQQVILPFDDVSDRHRGRMARVAFHQQALRGQEIRGDEEQGENQPADTHRQMRSRKLRRSACPCSLAIDSGWN